MKKNKFSIAIASTQYKLPHGQGASARVNSYAKGFSNADIIFNIICLKPSETKSSNINQAPSGKIYNAHYKYTSGTTISSNNKFIRYYQNLIGLLKAFTHLNEIKKASGLDVIILYGTESILYSVIFKVYSLILNSKLVAENTELPFVYRKDNLFKKILVYINDHITTKLYDGIIVISSHLFEKYKKIAKKDKIIIIPSITDCNAFSRAESPKTTNEDYVTYCGNLYNISEIHDLLKIWSMVKYKKNHTLLIIGDNSSKSVSTKIDDIIKSYNISESVKFTGLVSFDDLVNLYSKSNILLLPRKKGVFSTAGLPNKLAEYLASGKPVITSDVGDIKIYLSHMENSYIVPENNLIKFSDILQFAIDNQMISKNIGENGSLIAKKYFDAESNCIKLSTFLHSL